MEVENMAPQPVIVRHIGPQAMARDMEGTSEKSRVWKRAALAAAAGALFGFAASVWLETLKAQPGAIIENSSQQTSIVVVPALAKQATDASAEAEKLKTRNRRLEALVQVLQQRAQLERRDHGLKTRN